MSKYTNRRQDEHTARKERKPCPPKRMSKVGIPQQGDRPERVRLLPGEKRA